MNYAKNHKWIYIKLWPGQRQKNYSKLYWIQQYSVNLIKPRNDTQCVFTLGPDHLLLLINLCINHALTEGICSERKPSLFGILKLIYFST